MILIANCLVALVAALHVYFLVLEMFLWTKPLGLKTFRNSIEKATKSAVLAANQGLYNGFLAAGLVWGLVHTNPGFAFQIKVFFLLCVIVAGVYGAATVSRRILYRAGCSRGARIDSALAGLKSFTFLGTPRLALQHAVPPVSAASDGARRAEARPRTRPSAQSHHMRNTAL